MAKSLRSKSKQRVKRLRRAKFYEREKKKCWEKHQSLKDEKNDQEMDVEAGKDKESPSEVKSDTAMEDVTTGVTTEGDIPKLSRKKLEKLMKQQNTRRSKHKRKRLGGKKSHSKW